MKPLRPLAPTESFLDDTAVQNTCFRDVSRLLTSISVDHILSQQDFAGLGLFLKAPLASDAKRSWLNSLVQCSILDNLKDRIATDPVIFQNSRALTNLVKLIHQSSEAAAEGWFVDPESSLVQFTALFLGQIQRRDIRDLKSVRLCSPLFVTTQNTLAFLILSHMLAADESLFDAESAEEIPSVETSDAPRIGTPPKNLKVYNMLVQSTSVLQIPVSTETTSDGPLRSVITTCECCLMFRS